MLARAEIPFTERDLRKDPLSEAEIRAIVGGRRVSDFYATRSPRNRALGVDPARLSDEEMIVLMAREPTLIRRPLVVVGENGEVMPGATGKQLEAMAERLR